MIELTLEQYNALLKDSARLEIIRDYLKMHKYTEMEFIKTLVGVAVDA